MVGATVGVHVRQRAVQPGGALERQLAVQCRVDPGGQPLGGRERVGVQPAGAQLESQLGGGDLVGGGQPGVRRVAGGQLDEDRGVLVEDALAPGGVDGRDHPTSVAGRVVDVAQGDLEPRDRQSAARAQLGRPEDLAGTPGQHHGDRGPRGDLREVGVADHEGAHQPRGLAGAVGVRRQGGSQGRVAGREGRRVVDEPDPERVGDGFGERLGGHCRLLGHGATLTVT